MEAVSNGGINYHASNNRAPRH